MRSRLILPAFLLFIVVVLVSFMRDDDPVKAILSGLEKFRSGYPQEKVHLQLDKPFYAIGDDIWFKAYVVDAEAHQLSGLSKVLNVELISGQDSVKQRLRLPLIAGMAWGDFHLADTLREGNYRIRAYTNYMRNFDSGYYFDQTLQVGEAFLNDVVATASYQFNGGKVSVTINYMDMKGNALFEKPVSYKVMAADLKQLAGGKAVTDDKGDIRFSFQPKAGAQLAAGSVNAVLTLGKTSSVSKSFPIKTASNETDVQFFPEGGSLVAGIRSRVAFKALGSDGLGKAVTGYVSNTANEKVAEFQSAHAGMGTFILQPEAGKSYTATIKFPDGSEKQVPLPQAQPEGYVLGAVNTDSANLQVRISASPAMLAAGGQVTLVAQSNSAVKFVSQNKLEGPVFSASIPKSKFPTGITQLTLFNQQGQPLAERLVFINHNDQLQINVNGPKTSATRKKVKLELDVKDKTGKPVFGSLSVAVTDETKVPVNENEERTIMSDLLLTSDLKGYIEQPNYYFTGNTTDNHKVQELDNLLLTQGWRRFTWQAILNNNFPQLAFQPETGISISGRVTLHNKPVEGGKVILLSSKKGFFMTDTLTDKDGHFTFDHMIFPDSTRFIVQARTSKDKKFVDIRLDSIPEQLVTKNPNAPEIEVNVNKKLLSYLKNNRQQFEAMRQISLLNRNIMLNEVKIVAQQAKHVKGSASLAREANFVFHQDDFGACIDILSCLQGRVPGLMIRRDIPYLMRSMNIGLSPTPMTIMIDGIMIPHDHDEIVDALGTITPFDVEGVEILEGANAAIYGMQGAGGVIVITTKSAGGERYYNPYTPGKISYTPKGYYQAREFYSPNYDAPKTSVQKPDLRSTVLWQPNVVVKNGKAAFEYFNADGKGPYRVTIEGIDDHGNLARQVYHYLVN